MDDENESSTNSSSNQNVILIIVVIGFGFIIIWICLLFYRYRQQINHENRELRSTLENGNGLNRSNNLQNSMAIPSAEADIVLARKYLIEDVFPAKPLRDICSVFIRLR